MKAKNLILILVLSSMVGVGTVRAAMPEKTFIYRVKITDVTNTSAFEAVNTELKSIFDARILFNDTTDEIIIHSDMDVSQEKLTERLNVSGYLLKSYRQVALNRSNN